MKGLNGEETLWVVLPILLVIGILVASIIILPKAQTETRSKASEPTITPTKVLTVTPTQSTRPEIVCSSLYSPVCSNSGVTYPNECEANQAGVTSFTQGECPSAKATPTQIISTSPKILPATN